MPENPIGQNPMPVTMPIGHGHAQRVPTGAHVPPALVRRHLLPSAAACSRPPPLVPVCHRLLPCGSACARPPPPSPVRCGAACARPPPPAPMRGASPSRQLPPLLLYAAAAACAHPPSIATSSPASTSAPQPPSEMWRWGFDFGMDRVGFHCFFENIYTAAKWAIGPRKTNYERPECLME